MFASKPDLLEQLGAEALRFVDHQRRDLAARTPLAQHLLEFAQQARLWIAQPRG